MQRIVDRVTQQHLTDPVTYVEKCQRFLMQMDYEENPPSENDVRENWESAMNGLKELQNRRKNGV